MRGLRGRYSGLCQPTYVLDIPGGHGKSPIGPDYLSGETENATIEDWQGAVHAIATSQRQPEADGYRPRSGRRPRSSRRARYTTRKSASLIARPDKGA